MRIKFTDAETEWLYSGIPLNETTMSRAVPYQKLRELFDSKIECERLGRALSLASGALQAIELSPDDFNREGLKSVISEVGAVLAESIERKGEG